MTGVHEIVPVAPYPEVTADLGMLLGAEARLRLRLRSRLRLRLRRRLRLRLGAQLRGWLRLRARVWASDRIRSRNISRVGWVVVVVAQIRRFRPIVTAARLLTPFAPRVEVAANRRMLGHAKSRLRLRSRLGRRLWLRLRLGIRLRLWLGSDGRIRVEVRAVVLGAGRGRQRNEHETAELHWADRSVPRAENE